MGLGDTITGFGIGVCCQVCFTIPCGSREAQIPAQYFDPDYSAWLQRIAEALEDIAEKLEPNKEV